MADENKFFRVLWRFNSIAFACIVVAIGLGILALGLFFLVDNHTRSAFAPHPKESLKQYKYVLSSEAKVLEGASEVYFYLWRVPQDYERRSPYSSYGGSSEWQVNLLVLDTGTGKGRWLFRGTGQNLESVFKVQTRITGSTSQEEAPVKALLLTVSDSDTNKDGVLDLSDKKSIYLYRPGGAGVAKLLTVDEVISLSQIDADSVLLVARDGASTKSLLFSTQNFQVRAQSTVPAYDR